MTINGTLPRCDPGNQSSLRDWLSFQDSEARLLIEGRAPMQRAQPSPDTLAQASFICRRAGGCRRGADHTFGYFLLGKQEKVTRRKGEKGKIRFTQWFRK
ncbi:hypothetical protein PA6_005_00260 [Aquipseudomonas alcaligenes NBRC 14159]|uniref:Uncharacterized protein n=1 Tax=Aquipseudomonas alcaligenes (strain ATCC 14909 / DSM 50342 / CCUG 1425 / JCM 20561 / NBRC 14159 / NCIMB 9945 / NCTC 10367 / 1577) TaxID=1215092 RepID=U3ATY2_AQUA1|nr:hypothetical protein PA6_005_00260 [Pseudomonas alcaligenes NBRC 14159]